MGSLKEWLSLIPDAFKNADKIVQGVVADVMLGYGALPEDERDEIIRRRVICEGCPYMSENAKETGEYVSKRKDKHCIFCKCPIQTRTAALSANCGIQSYNNKHPEKPLPLKWEVYIKPETNEESGK